MAVIGTVTCPKCGNDANRYQYANTAQQHWYCTKSSGGCGHFGGIAKYTDAPAINSERTCDTCEQSFAIAPGPEGPTQTTCKPCQRLAKSIYRIAYMNCEWCDLLFTYRPSTAPRGRHYCSDACSGLAGRKRMQERRKDNNQPRYRFPRDKALAIAYKHAYKCHLCGTLIDVSQKPPHPKALHIDHLIPQAEGGTHATNNLAPAHLECNSHRQHTGPAQLQAFGAH